MELRPTARFCDDCGAAVDASAVAPSTTTTTLLAPQHQARKIVTIVFADLVGSTALHERLDPESVQSVMQRYYTLVRDVVEARQGHVVKFIGDGVMAVFGVPETHEDDAVRALDASLAMHDAFADLAAQVARERGASIALRVGVNTGEVVVRDGDDDVVGDAVNVAARLEHAAAPGTVLVGDATWRLTRTAAVFDESRELHVAGKSETVRARTVRSLASDRREARTELVGRVRELATLERAFADAVEEHAPRLVTVLGSPGVGKTRLATELERRVRDGATVLVARCAREQRAPLAPVADLVATTTDGPPGEQPTAPLRRLAERITSDDADRERVLRTVDAIVETGAGATPEESLWALRRLVESLARERPVVLVVDDLQWGAPMLLDLVEHLGEWTRGAVLVVVLARPELRELRGALADGARHGLIALEGLDADGTAALARELLGAAALPDGLLDRLPASTGGNPLFVRELLGMLIDDDVLRVGAGGAWELRVAPDAIDVPPTIQSLLAARLDRLSADEQLLMERASIWGTEFPLGALVEIVPSDIRPRVPAVIEQLRRKELLESGGTYWIDEPVHRFHHVLIRDAAYRRMLRDLRADLHERIAQWVEHKTAALDAEYDELVGHHLEQAYSQRVELGPPAEATIAVGRLAAQHLGRAAQRALDRDDASAASLAARALDCLPPDDAARAELLLVQCEALLSAADAVAAREAVAELERVAASSARLRAWAACFAAQLATLTDPAHLRDTERAAAAIAAQLADLGDARGAAKGHAVHAAALARLGRFGEVEAALDRALTCARDAGDRRLATVALAAAPVAAVWGPSPVPRAGGRCLDVVRLLRITAGSPVVEATSVRCQAVLESFRGRTDAARRLIASARATLEELGLDHGLLEADLFAGIVELAAGDLDGAAAALARAADGLRRLGADADSARAGALLALVALQRDDLETAERLARDAEALAGDDLQAGIAWRRVAAEVLARRGRFDEARALAEAAVAIAAQTDALVNHADACTALAAVHRAAGDVAGAERAAHQAIELYERKGATALAALVRGAQRAAAPPDATRSVAVSAPGGVANRCTDALRQVSELFAAREFEGMSDAVAAAFVYDDRRPGVQHRLDAREGVATSRVLAEWSADLHFEPCAVRGERLALVVASAPGATPDSFAAESELGVVELDDRGRIASFVAFALDDLDGAVAELERRYLVGEGAPYATMWSLLVRTQRAANDGDWEALRAMFAPDAPTINHLGGGWNDHATGAAQADAAAGALSAFADTRLHAPRILAISDTVAAAVQQVLNGSPLGDTASTLIYVIQRTGSQIARTEVFDAGAVDDAMAAFRRLSGESELTNAAIRVMRTWTTRFAADDLASVAALAAADFVAEDRRPGLRHRTDLAEATAELELLAQQGFDRMAMRPIATRGDRLALVHLTAGASRDTEPMHGEIVAVVEVDAEGRLAWMARYEPEQLDDAIAELESRYLAGEGAPFASIWSPCVAMVRALGRRDWDALRGCCAPSFVIRDSYSGGWGDVTDREAAVRTWFEMVDAIPDFEVVQRRIVDIAGDTVLAELAVTYGPDGEVRYFSLAHVGPDGLDRLESFRDDDLEEARRAFGRLAGDALTNRAVETFRRWVGRFEARDWDGCRGLCIPEFRADDVRPVVRNHEDIDRAALDIELQAAAGVRSMALRPIATRGDRLALIAIKWIGDDELFTPETLSVVESTDDGRLVRTTAYALEQLDDAVAELDQRFLDGEAAPYAAVWAHQVAATRAVNAHDWDAFRTELADDCESVDHITGGWRTRRGADAVIGEVRGAVELLGGDARGCTTQVVAISPRALLTLHRWTSGDSDGISEMAVVSVTGIGRGGITSMHSFGPDDLGAARAVYRSLAGDDLTNAAIESYRGWADHLAARDWEQANTFGAPGLRVEDVRPVVGDVDVGRRVGANAHAMASIGLVGSSVRPIATRGARLALAAVRWSDEEDSTASFGEETLNVVEVDADGRFVAITIHAPEALDAAIDELDRRYLEGEGAPFARWLDHLLVRGNATMNAHDWEGLRALYDPEVRVTDHATGGWGDATGIDDFLDGIRALVDAMPGTRVMTTAVPAVSAGAAVCVMRLAAPQHDFEHTTVLLHRRGTRGITSVDAFAPSQLGEALARFRALASSRPLTNRCTETAQRWNDSFARRDWDAAARLAEPDFVLDDRRPVIGFDERGADAMADVRHLAARGVGHIRHETIATRGESLALARVSSAEENNVDGFVTEALAVIALSDRRRLASFTMFNSDELDAAIAELEARYLAGEAAGHADVWRVLVSWRDTFNARDWDGSRAALSAQFVVTDHAPVGFGVRAPGETEEMARAFVAVSPDTRMDFVEVVALAADRVVLHVVNTSGSHGDAEFATEGWQVIRVADGLLRSLDMYALEQRDEALARFEALARAHD